jgi:hypothetical protein
VLIRDAQSSEQSAVESKNGPVTIRAPSGLGVPLDLGRYTPLSAVLRGAELEFLRGARQVAAQRPCMLPWRLGLTLSNRVTSRKR